MANDEKLEVDFRFAPTRADLHSVLDRAIMRELEVDSCEAFSCVEFAINIVEALEESSEPEALAVIAAMLAQYPKFLEDCRNLPPNSFSTFPSPFPIKTIA